MAKRQPPGLKRSVGVTMLTLYGLGNILGAGIYVLVGKVAGVAGSATVLAFVMAAVGVAFTVFSYAELAARYPLSAGEALYVQRAFGFRHLSTAVGLLVLFSGICSSAAIAQGFAGYFQLFVAMDRTLLITLLLLTLGMVAVWGIGESLTVVALFTLLEAAGLLLVVTLGGRALFMVGRRGFGNNSAVTRDPGGGCRRGGNGRFSGVLSLRRL